MRCLHSPGSQAIWDTDLGGCLLRDSQLASSLKNPRATIAALVFAAIVIFGLTPLFPVLASFDVAIAVFATIAVTWFTRKKTETGEGNTPTSDPAKSS